MTRFEYTARDLGMGNSDGGTASLKHHNSSLNIPTVAQGVRVIEEGIVVKGQPTQRRSVSPKEFAEMHGVSMRTVWRLIADGRLGTFRIAHLVRIPISECQRIEENV